MFGTVGLFTYLLKFIVIHKNIKSQTVKLRGEIEIGIIFFL